MDACEIEGLPATTATNAGTDAGTRVDGKPGPPADAGRAGTGRSGRSRRPSADDGADGEWSAAAEALLRMAR
jgi:hypothetical protein